MFCWSSSQFAIINACMCCDFMFLSGDLLVRLEQEFMSIYSMKLKYVLYKQATTLACIQPNPGLALHRSAETGYEFLLHFLFRMVAGSNISSLFLKAFTGEMTKFRKHVVIFFEASRKRIVSPWPQEAKHFAENCN
jgi:hypothetical protein